MTSSSLTLMRPSALTTSFRRMELAIAGIGGLVAAVAIPALSYWSGCCPASGASDASPSFGSLARLTLTRSEVSRS